MNAYANQYQNNQIATASREQILLMLYDGAIRFSKQAKHAIEQDNMEDKAKFISKTMAIITEFSNSLDHEIGGEIAANLDALYNYMLQELTKANVKHKPEPIDGVCNMLCELREAWAEAINIVSNETAEQHAAAQKSFVTSAA